MTAAASRESPASTMPPAAISRFEPSGGDDSATAVTMTGQASRANSGTRHRRSQGATGKGSTLKRNGA